MQHFGSTSINLLIVNTIPLLLLDQWTGPCWPTNGLSLPHAIQRLQRFTVGYPTFTLHTNTYEIPFPGLADGNFLHLLLYLA